MFRLVLETKPFPKENSHLEFADLKVLLKPAILLSGSIYWQIQIVQKTIMETFFGFIGKVRLSFHLAVLESIYISTKNRYCVDKKSSVSPYGSIRNILKRQAVLIGQPQHSYARFSDWSISIHNLVYLFPRVEYSIYVLTF